MFAQDDWDEREKIPDPTATKPDDWDESQPATIPDTDAMKPEGWLDEESKLVPDPDAVKPTDWYAAATAACILNLALFFRANYIRVFSKYS